MVNEIRILICGWLFNLALRIVPKNHPEGRIIIKGVHDIAAQVVERRKARLKYK